MVTYISASFEPGLIDSEVLAYFNDVDGNLVEVPVDESLKTHDSFRVFLIRQEGDRVLIELPQESSSGHWRVWAPSSLVNPERASA